MLRKGLKMFKIVFLVFIHLLIREKLDGYALDQRSAGPCLFQNSKYSNEYLTSKNGIVSTSHFEDSDNIESLSWKLKTLVVKSDGDSNQTVYQMFKNSNQCLCATAKFEKLISPRYKVIVSNKRMVQISSTKRNNECLWHLEQTAEFKSVIRNVAYPNEYLFADSHLAKLKAKSGVKRRIYSSRSDKPSKDEFLWTIWCSN